MLVSASVQAKDFAIPAVDLRQGEFVQGQLFSVKYVPGSRSVSFMIVGKKAAGLQIGDMKPQLRFVSKDSVYPLEQQGKSFIYRDEIKEDAVLEVQSKGGKETFKIKKP